MPKGYVIVTPTFTFDVLGKPATSASELRKQFVSLDNKTQKEFVKDLFGKYDASVHKLLSAKLPKPKTVKQLKESFGIGLTFARNDMPQIGAAQSFIKYLKDNGVTSNLTTIKADDYKSSQMEFDPSKIESMRQSKSTNPIIVSNDGHILDGHHRWLADKMENRPCDAYVCDLPILDLLYHAKHYSKNLTEEIQHKEFGHMLDSFVSFAADKLGIATMPKVRYKNSEDDYNSFAAYNPSKHELSVSTKNRHPMDIFRSVAHELVHHKQKEEDRIGKDVAAEGSTGSDIENEANAKAGIIMRQFAKAHPDMFGKSYVVETNAAAMGGGIRGLGNVTGEVSPDGTPQYVVDNEAYTKEIQNKTSGLYTLDLLNSWLDPKGIQEYQKRAVKGFKSVRGQLNEGINDPGKLKAIFLAGGPGSGKDYVMNAVLQGEGLKEINSDVAFEFLMKKNNLDLEMPDEERVERDIVRGRAKNITKEKERLALAGRLGLIINGTADDLEKIKHIKKNLEADGYETMMVFVNTSNEVSRQRNVERGKAGNRKVPDGTDKNGNPDDSPNIRQEKWDAAQKNIGELQKIFGNNSFAVIDNSVDARKATPEEKEKVNANFNRVRRMAQQFVRAENQNPAAKKWISGEAEKRGITQFQEPKRYKTLTQIRQSVPNVIHKPDNELMAQARRLGLSYYGFGRFGRKVGNQNRVLFHSKGGKLERVQTMNEEKKMKNPCWKGYKAYGMKKKNGKEVPNCVPANEAFENFVAEADGNKATEREIGTKSLTKVYKKMTPGEKKKKLSQEAMEASVQGGYAFGADGIGPTIGVPRAGTPYGFGYGSAYSAGISESIVSWMKSEKTQLKFQNKYGDLWEEKLVKAAVMLEEAGCGCEHSKQKKPFGKMREGMEGGVNNMSMVPTQRKGEQEANEQTELETMPRDYSNKFLTPKVDPSKKPQYMKARRHKEFIAQNYHPERIVKDMHESSPAWQRKEGKSESGGLNRKGIASYRRENPGSKLSMAVTTKPSKLKKGSKAANRRKSFCARMSGMKKRLTSAKTARDPNSRINKSLRKWNCEE